jgi:hypothetical protein
VPIKAWIKAALDYVIQISVGEPDLEFVWIGDDAIDPLQQAQTLNILVGAGIMTIAINRVAESASAGRRAGARSRAAAATPGDRAQPRSRNWRRWR